MCFYPVSEEFLRRNSTIFVIKKSGFWCVSLVETYFFLFCFLCRNKVVSWVENVEVYRVETDQIWLVSSKKQGRNASETEQKQGRNSSNFEQECLFAQIASFFYIFVLRWIEKRGNCAFRHVRIYQNTAKRHVHDCKGGEKPKKRGRGAVPLFFWFSACKRGKINVSPYPKSLFPRFLFSQENC